MEHQENRESKTARSIEIGWSLEIRKLILKKGAVTEAR